MKKIPLIVLFLIVPIVFNITAHAESQDLLSEYQSILTYQARDWEEFTINEVQYLVVANKNGNSEIYKWINSQQNGTFEPYQTIQTEGAVGWEYFEMGDDKYLIVARSDVGADFRLKGEIYKWNPSLCNEEEQQCGKFIEGSIPSIPTIGAYDWEHFVINGETYLVVANSNDGSYSCLNSKIYKFIPNSNPDISYDGEFVEIQEIETCVAYDWEHFEINEDDHYLAVANFQDENNGPHVYNIDSKIYKWNESAEIFEKIQSIPTHGAADWEHFKIGEDAHYLAVANFHDGSTYDNLSKVYKWKPDLFNAESKQYGKFEVIQTIQTNSPFGWESFTSNNKTYLAVTSFYGATSQIYEWNPLSENEEQQQNGEFKVIQEIPTNGAIDWKAFEIDTDTYIAVANAYDGNSFNIESKIYKLKKIDVSFDIKPGSCTNPLNVKSKGVLPVAILGAIDFDVTQVDTLSVSLEGISPIRSSYEDVSTENSCFESEIDGYTDLTLKFKTQDIVEAIGYVEDGDEITLKIEGMLSDGTSFEGEDVVTILKKGKK